MYSKVKVQNWPELGLHHSQNKMLNHCILLLYMGRELPIFPVFKYFNMTDQQLPFAESRVKFFQLPCPGWGVIPVHFFSSYIVIHVRLKGCSLWARNLTWCAEFDVVELPHTTLVVMRYKTVQLKKSWSKEEMLFL